MTQSAGFLVFKRNGASVEVLLAHPGGPIWGHKDFWSIPKGELDEDEDHLAAARREFEEEIGLPVPEGKLLDLGSAKGSGGKVNFVWAVEGDIDLSQFHCNTFTMEWPPRSGRMQEYPENDRAGWFTLPVGRAKVFENQAVFLDRLAKELGLELAPPTEQQSLL